ncbi:MAG: methyltransferase domain-containing protein [Nitrospira sp. CR1.3]|nr:methyltransferase domain-containing protein [Nitrospira sp. CR1.3]
MISDSLQRALIAHLESWGLRRFTSDDAYFQWQRQLLSAQELSALHGHVERKRQGSAADEVAFYDATAHPRILPVLYSQRYDYYLTIGSLVASRIADAQTVLDFGCGVGILTTFYAKRFPHIRFVGVDRSAVSISQAQDKAKALGLENLRFDCREVAREPLPGRFDLVVATHALVQVEQDPGLPSRDWTTFERAHDVHQQSQFEERTGIGTRLDRLCAALSTPGRMIVFEKTRQLSRRVPFQRALTGRGLSLVEQPEPIRYRLVEEIADDGPFYLMKNEGRERLAWDESPEPDEGLPFNPSVTKPAAAGSDEPLYENHHASAQAAWQRLHNRSIVKETTKTETDGRQLHVEFGRSDEGRYLYCANTFDRRQLVIVEPARAAMLDAYYHEIAGG